jgi:phosphogluconate dehydratase
VIRLDSTAGCLSLLVPAEELAQRTPGGRPLSDAQWVGTGRELFTAFRRMAGHAEQGAGIFGVSGAESPHHGPGLGFPAESGSSHLETGAAVGTRHAGASR